MNKQELVKNEENQMIAIIDQSGIEKAVGKLIEKNNSLLPNNVATERIKNSAGFYIANRDDLMQLGKDGKLNMLYGILKEAMVGCEAGTDYDIIPFKGKPTIIRKKEGWFKIIDMIKPAEIVRFTSNVIVKGDEYSYNPVTEELTHKMNNTSDKYDDVEGAYCYIKFANGFEKTVFMSKKDIDTIKKVSPSASTPYSPWTTMPMKMIKTKVVKEMAKELFTLFSARVNSTLAKAISSDETAIDSVDVEGHIIEDNTIFDGETIEPAQVIEPQQENQPEEKQVNLEDI